MSLSGHYVAVAHGNVYFELCVSNAGSFKRSITDVDFINFLKYA